MELIKELIKTRVHSLQHIRRPLTFLTQETKTTFSNHAFHFDLEPFYHTRVERFSDCSVKTAFSLKSK